MPAVKPPISIGVDFYCQFPGMKPARQVISRAPHRTVGSIHASWFQTAPIHHDSDLEAGIAKILLLAPTVESIQPRAIKLTYSDGAEERTHVPDFLVQLKDKRTAVVEGKPERFVPEHRQKFDACATLLRQRDVDYFVCTDKHAHKARVARADELLQAARMAAPAEQLGELIAWVKTSGRATVQEALSKGYNEMLVEHAVGRRLLLTDPTLDLAPGSWLTTQESADELLCIDHWLGCSPWPPRTGTPPRAP